MSNEWERLIALSNMEIYLPISERLTAVALVKKGLSRSEVARRCGRTLSWVLYWEKRYNVSGIRSLFSLPMPGQPKKLNTSQELRFKQRISNYNTDCELQLTPYSLEKVGQILKSEFKVKYSPSGVSALLKRLGVVFGNKIPHAPKTHSS